MDKNHMINKIVIIPLGGLGTRFKSAGYNLPKPLINVMGNPIVYWLLENLNLQDIEYVYIPYNKELKKYRFEDQLRKDFPKIKFKFFCLEYNTRGAAETIKISLDHLNEQNDKHVMCVDSDNFYTEDFISDWNGENSIVTFEDYFADPVFSYVEVNSENKLIDIKEKCKISNNACSGVYSFSSLYKLLDTCNYIIQNNIMDKNEFYMSVVVKQMILKGEDFYNKQINKDNYHCLGTPLQVKIFCNNFKKICTRLNRQLMKKKRYCFDLDNTLVTFPKVTGDYTTVEPIKQNIETLRYLKDLGHTIIIYTARKMKTCGSNMGKVMANIGQITFNTLEKFNIPYDEIFFGKPYADYYIDDLAISSYDNLEKELGFHKTDIDPRDYNSVERTDFETIKKKSGDLSGEIYYYKNIPNRIKDLFPIFVNYDNNNTWYQIEKINGISVSKLYLAGELTENILKNIMECIRKIQVCDEKVNSEINIYSNYSSKLKKRYEQYDYSKFENSEKVYNEIYQKLEDYQIKKKGNISVVHGDPVFTNILLDQYSKLKFIDMRGKNGDELSIFGDWLYDWAKLYQSLIGYDEILDEKDLDLTYKSNMIDFFKKYFIDCYTKDDFENLKLITKSLLFSLIPLHNNDKCKKYYELINNCYLV
jgi:capsule biosynthesis phosphatase